MTDLAENGQRFHDEAEEETEEHIIPEEELNKRRKYLEDLKTFLTEHQEKISLTLEQLGWTPEHLIKPQNKVTCPFNSSHIIPESSLDKHLETCQWLSKGVPRYQLKDVLDEKERVKNTSISTIQLDECKLNGILWNKAVKSGQVYTGQRKLPITPEDDTIILTPDERLAVHDYIVSEAQSQGIMMNVEKDEHLTIDWQKVIKKGVLESETSDKLTPLEKMEALRDFKRRRQKYRAKNVHITRKSYTEIIREVISNQVEMWGAEGEENKGDVEVVEDTDVGQDSGSVNRESRGNQDYSGYSRDTGRGRSDRDRTDRGKDRESDRRRSSRDDRDRGSYRGQSRESSCRDRDQSRESYRDQSRETYRDSRRDQSRESYREKGNEQRDYDRDYSRERNRKRERSRERSRSSERRPPKREKYEVSQIKSESETTPMLDYVREESRSETSHRDRYQEDSSSRSHKKSKKHKHKKKHKKHKDRRKSSSSSDSESSK